MSYNEWLENRENQHINQLTEELCLNILEKEINFDEWWEKEALPVIIEGDYNNEIELFKELFGIDNWKKSTANPSNWFGGNQGTSWSGKSQSPDMAGMMSQWQQKQGDTAHANAQGQMDTQFQGHMENLKTGMRTLKKLFKSSLRSYIANAQKIGAQYKLPMLQKVAASIANELNQTHSQIISQNFVQLAKKAKQDQFTANRSDFDNAYRNV